MSVRQRREHLLSIIGKGYTGGFIVTDAVDALIKEVRVKAKEGRKRARQTGSVTDAAEAKPSVSTRRSAAL